MRNARKWLRRLLLAIMAVLALLWLLQNLLFPSLIRNQLVNRLHAQGFHSVAVAVDQVSFTSATIRDLRADTALSVPLVHVTYTPRKLLSGKVQDIIIQGATLNPLAWPPQPASSTQPSSTLPTQPIASTTAPVFDHLTIRDSALVIPTSQGVTTAPVQAQANALDHRIIGSADLSTQGFAAKLNLDADGALTNINTTLNATCDLAYLPALLSHTNLSLQGQATLSATAHLTTSPQFAWKLDDARLQITSPEAGLAGSPLRVRNLNTLFHLAGEGAAGDFSAHLLSDSSISASDLTISPKWPAFPVQIQFRPTDLIVNGDRWRLDTQGATLAAGDAHFEVQAGRYGVASNQAFGQIQTLIDLNTVGQSQLLRTIYPSLANVRLGGTLLLNLSRTFENDLRKASITAKLTDGTISSQQYQLTADGIEGEITILDPTHPHSAPSQQIKLAYGQMGKWEVRDGLFQFTLKDLNTLSVEKTELGWLGGRIWTDPYNVEFSTGLIRSRVYGKDLDLGKLIWIISNEKAWGDGTVSLDLPVTLQWPNMRFGNGYVEAKPGGRLHLNYVADQLSRYLVATDPRFGTDPTYSTIRDRMVDALKNFAFKRLQAIFRRSDPSLETLLQVQGKGATEGGQEINLNVTVSDLDWFISRYLSLRRTQ